MTFSKYNTKRFSSPPPVKEGDTYDVEIINVGEKGDGIAKIDGFVIVVPNTEKGQKVKVKVTAVRGKVSFAEVVGEGAPKAAEDKEEDSEDEAEEEGDSEDDDAKKTDSEGESAEESVDEADEPMAEQEFDDEEAK